MIAVSWLILSPSRFQVLSTPATRPPLNLNLMPGLNLGNTIFTLHLSLCSMCSCTLYYMTCGSPMASEHARSIDPRHWRPPCRIHGPTRSRGKNMFLSILNLTSSSRPASYNYEHAMQTKRLRACLTRARCAPQVASPQVPNTHAAVRQRFFLASSTPRLRRHRSC